MNYKLSSENKLVELKQRIEHLSEELETTSQSTQPMPELINATNILRANEYLTRINAKKTEIISSYAEYVKELEQLVSSVLERKIAFLKKAQTRLQKTKKKQKRKQAKKSKRRSSKKQRR